MKTIRLPARQENLRVMIDFVSDLARERGFGPKRILEVELAAEEALVNILTYAYPKGAGDIEIACKGEGGSRLTFAITDFGVAFDPLSFPVPDLLVELAIRRVGGLGVFFVRQMADHIEYQRKGDANVLTLTFTKREPQKGENSTHTEGT
ncbi:MAG: ATP-binding protein [Desulfobacterales bacterium]|nr:ATP-binding protein [Desulfobacterales bacterium]